ncbi:MAG: outer membrane beta-barrel domain-containing protein [Pseudomonadota bacterium]
MRILWNICCLLIVLGTPISVFAQNEEDVAPLLDQYWTRRVEAVQSRTFEKKGAFELVGLAGVIPNDSLIVYVPVGVRAAYHFTEQWAVEASFEYAVPIHTGLRNSLEKNAPNIWLGVDQGIRGSLDVLWSALYGKVAAGRNVLQFDLYFLAGAGIVSTLDRATQGLLSAVRPDFNFGTGIRTFWGDRWVIRLEYRQYLYLQPKSISGEGGGIGVPSELILCAGLLLGGSR